MTTIRIVMLLLCATLSLPASLEAAVREAVCRVCAVKEGKNAPEPVKATRTHEGVEYGLCSERCAKEFALDPAAFVPPVLPRPAPPVRGMRTTGEPVAWDAYRGRVVLLDFWATWCVPCRASMPELQRLHDTYGARGLTVLGISIDEGGMAKVKRFVDAKRFTYPIALDDAKSPTWAAYRVKAVPAAFLVDTSGAVVAQWTGVVPPAEIESRLRELLAPAP